VTDRTGHAIWIALIAIVLALVLSACQSAANFDAYIAGKPSEPLVSGQLYMTQAFDRPTVMAKCLKEVGKLGHACTYRRAGDTLPTMIISIDDAGPVLRHELYHVAQGNRGEDMNHKGFK